MVLGYSCQSPRARGIDQKSRATRASFRGPVRSTSTPGLLALVSEVLRGRPAVPGHSGPGLRTHRVDQISRATHTRVLGPPVSTNTPGQIMPGSESPQGRPAVLRDSGQCPRARGVDQNSQVTPVRVRGPVVDHLSWETWALYGGTAVSIRGPGRLGPVPEAPRSGPLVPGNL